MSRKCRLQKHLADAVLSIIKRWRIGKKYTGKKRNPLVKQDVIMIVTES